MKISTVSRDSCHIGLNSLLRIVIILSTLKVSDSFVIGRPIHRSSSSLRAVDFGGLMDMDVVVYSKQGNPTKYMGAVQEDGKVSPLSVWSEDPVFGNSLEFVVDEEDRFPGLTAKDIEIHDLVPQNILSYGSRQVGGGKGPGNPHGEESELLYYVEKDYLDGIELVVKPELEILW